MQPSYHPYIFLSFFFFSSTRCPSLSLSPFFYLIPVPFLFYLLPRLDEVVSSHSLFFLQCSHSLSFFFLQYSLSLSLSLSLLDSALILSSFFTPALSLSMFFFFFFFLDSRTEYYGKTTLRQFSPLAFPPNLGGKNLWARERNFSPGFSTPPVFLSLPNKEKRIFLPQFPSYIFHPS